MSSPPPEKHCPPELINAWRTQGFEPLQHGELAAAAEMMASAFEADPLMAELLPDTRRPARAHKLLRFYRIQLRIFNDKGVCVAARRGQQLQAVLAFLPPRRVLTLSDEVLNGGLALLPLLGWHLPAALDVQSRASTLRQRHGPGAWYTALAAVAPAAQKQGWLRRGMAPVLTHAEQTGVGMYLETQNPTNVTVYQRMGLHLQETAPLGRLPHLAHHAMRTPEAAPRPHASPASPPAPAQR
ncbi:MAG: hypothetical protein Q4G70_00375 [Pseudomonadota bacterium]|nr:hypothetical protein [Pseudomonadota bacterium]